MFYIQDLKYLLFSVKELLSTILSKGIIPPNTNYSNFMFMFFQKDFVLLSPDILSYRMVDWFIAS